MALASAKALCAGTKRLLRGGQSGARLAHRYRRVIGGAAHTLSQGTDLIAHRVGHLLGADGRRVEVLAVASESVDSRLELG